VVDNREGVSMAKQDKVGLIDADILAYQAASIFEDKIDWDNDGDVRQYPHDIHLAYEYVDDTLGKWMAELKLNKVIICLTHKENFRKTILPTYKENRKGTMKPLHLLPIKKYLADSYPTYERPGLEADDVMGILSTHPKLVPGKKVIISIDKDMEQIPGYLFNPNKDKKPRKIKAIDGMRVHYMQTLTGDATDGYSGCPGIGPKKAEAILNGLDGTTWDRIVNAYAAKGLTEADALAQAQVAHICQWENYNYEKAEVIPWQPKEKVCL